MMRLRLQFVKACDKCGVFQDLFFYKKKSDICSKCCCQLRVSKAMLAFHESIWGQGGRTLGEYQASNIPVECECPKGHKCFPRPNAIHKGEGMCGTCSGRNSANAEKNFHQAITKLGGTVVGKYQGSGVSVECKCREGHTCNPFPTNIQKGRGMCQTCAGQNPVEVKCNFKKAITDKKGEVIGEYKGAFVPVECKCPKGHICFPYPTNIQKGQGMCRTCAGNDPLEAEKNFKKAIADQKGEVIGNYLGVHIPVECKCSEGHICFPSPGSIQQGRGICRACAGNDPVQAEKNFRQAIIDLGGNILGEYLGAHIPVECECPEGHRCSPRPNSIQQGNGMCSSCGFKSEDVCRRIFEEILGFKMSKVKLSWLKWRNGWPLELDGYNEEHKIAVEYQGIQHYEIVPLFHPNGQEDLESQKERDAFKAQKCLEKGVKLICVPCIYTYKNPTAMRKFIVSSLEM